MNEQQKIIKILFLQGTKNIVAGKILFLQGFRVVSQSNATVEQAPVVFIGRQGSAGVVTWNIPLQPQGYVLRKEGIASC